MAGSGWTPEKVESFRAAFLDFLKFVLIDSKEKGRCCLHDELYDAQWRLLDGIFSGLANDIHWFSILKSRQLGVSTAAEALFTFWIGMFEGLQATCVLDSAPHLKAARLRIRSLIKRLPASLKFPSIVEDSRDIMTLSNGSVVQWVAAGVRETESSGNLGRSAGCNLLWASEVSSWKNEEGVQSLIETLSESFPDRLYIFESTARGYNAWRDMWLETIESEYDKKAIFIGWWAHPLHRIERSDRRFDRYAADPTAKERDTIAKVKTDYNHEIVLEQLAWYRWKIDPTRDLEEGEKRNSQYRVQEQPSCAEDSFQITGSSFFDHVALNAQVTRISQAGPCKRYKFEFGEEFPHTRIEQAIHWRQVQLKVWEEPLPGVEYVVAGDVAHGRNPDNDRSAVQVLACYADCIEQVAEYACPTVNPIQFAWVIAALAAYYATRAQNVTTIIELDGPGESTWKEYEELPRKIRSSYMRPASQERGLTSVFNNVRNYIFNRPDAMTGAGNNWQWKTGNRKEAIMENCRALTATGQLILKSIDTVEEMRTIARDGASIEAPSGKHDDRVVALAIGIRGYIDGIRPGLMAKGRTKSAIENARQMTTQGRWQIFMQNSIGDMWARNAMLAKRAARQQRLANLRRR